MPILMLTARVDKVDRIVGLEVGADDYMTKPFSMREFLARVSDYTAFFYTDESRTGVLVEFGETGQLFTQPKDKRTEDYITGRFG